MDNKTFDGFLIKLYQDDDGDWLTHFEEMPNVSAFADTPDKARLALEEVWERILAIHQFGISSFLRYCLKRPN